MSLRTAKLERSRTAKKLCRAKVSAADMAERLCRAKAVAIDTETTGLDAWHGDQPFAIGFLGSNGARLYFEWPVDPWTRTVLCNPDELALVRRICRATRPIKVFHNAKFDIRMLDVAFGIEVRGKINDTMFMVHICNTLEPSLALKKLAFKYRQIDNEDEKELKKLVISCRRKAKKLGYSIHKDVQGDYWLPRVFDPTDRTCERYCMLDVERTLALWELFAFGIKQEDLTEVWEREQRLRPVTYEMETRGIRVNPEEVDKQIIFFQKQAKLWEKKVMKAAWKEFNIGSNPDMRRLIYEKLGFPIVRRTDKGTPQVDVDSLLPHLSHPVVEAIFRYRSSMKALSTYFEKYHKLKVLDPLNDGGWCIHADFQQVGPGTGRFSCRNPNFQNVANALTTRSPMPIQARTPFGPRPGYVWYHIDYEQVEVRIFADCAQEEVMLAAIAAGEDIHGACTNKAWGGKDNSSAIRAAVHALELDGTGTGENIQVNELWRKWIIQDHFRLTKEDKEGLADDWMVGFDYDIVKAEKSLGKKTCRAKAKMLIFAKIFGGGANVVKDLIPCSLPEAREFIEDYDRAMPGIKRYSRRLTGQARQDGFIWNRYNRRIAVDPMRAYRCVNYMVQGSAADLLKEAMIKCAAYLKATGLDAHIVLTIHDELVFEFRRAHAKRSVLRKLCRLMEDHGGAFGVPTPVGVEKVTASWNVKEPAVI